MSREGVEEFYQLILADEGLQARLMAEMGGHSEEDVGALAEMAVKLGREMGFDFTVGEALAAIEAMFPADGAELSDEDLDRVAGGKDEDWSPSPTPKPSLTEATIDNLPTPGSFSSGSGGGGSGGGGLGGGSTGA